MAQTRAICAIRSSTNVRSKRCMKRADSCSSRAITQLTASGLEGQQLVRDADMDIKTMPKKGAYAMDDVE